MKKLMSRLLIAMIAIVAVFSASTITASAATDESTVSSYVASKNYSDISSGVMMYLTKDGETGTTKLKTKDNIVVYYKKSDLSSLVYAVNAAADKGNEIESINGNIDDITGNLNMEADTKSASDSLSGVIPVVNYFVGMLTLLVMIGMSLWTAIDIMYITWPLFSDWSNNQVTDGHGVMAKKDKEGGTKLRFVTREAQWALKTATIENGQNVIKLYFSKRFWSYIILAMVIYIFFSGNFSIITKIALKLVSGVLKLIGQF